MITPADIKNDARKSGYVGVRLERIPGRPKPYCAEKGDWDGTHRATALEAAQDYCDYVNGLPPLTIEDIRNPSRKSGFDHVNSASRGAGAQAKQPNSSNVLWRAEDGRGNTHGTGTGPKRWKGRSRAIPEEAAQDYCDYINASRTATPVTLNTAGHVYDIDKTERDPEVEAALGVLRDAKAQREGKQGYVYLITDGTAYKIGYSVNPKKRVAELQTGNPRILSLVAYVKGTEADERALHAKYIELNLLQEWFDREAAILDEFKNAEGVTISA